MAISFTSRFRLGWVALLLLSSALMNGCAANRFQGPVGSFYNATQQTVGVLANYYTTRNSYEIDVYLSSVAADSTLAVQTTDAKGNPTPLGAPVFSPASIQARLDALNLVAAYAQRLNDLANTQAPANFQTAATALGTNLSTMGTTFQKLAGTSDPTANKFVGPVSSLIGTIGQMYLEQKRDAAIQKAVQDGAPQVDIILAQVRDDMDKIFALEVVTGANEKLALLIAAYNHDRSKLDFDQRTARLAQIKAAAEEASASVSSAPSSLVTDMMNAHAALVKSATATPKDKPLTLAALNAALEGWTNQIQTLSSQVKLLIH
jgi:hypothetical protein